MKSSVILAFSFPAVTWNSWSKCESAGSDSTWGWETPSEDRSCTKEFDFCHLCVVFAQLCIFCLSLEKSGPKISPFFFRGGESVLLITSGADPLLLTPWLYPCSSVLVLYRNPVWLMNCSTAAVFKKTTSWQQQMRVRLLKPEDCRPINLEFLLRSCGSFQIYNLSWICSGSLMD